MIVENAPRRNPESQPPLAPWRARASLLLGLGGMIVYVVALQAARGWLTSAISRAIVEAYHPVWIACFGCAAFVAAVTLAFQFRLRSLLILIFSMGALIGIASMHFS